MIDVKLEKGSFTIEATFICSLILIISANIIIEALWIYDKCIINEEINRYMLRVEELLEDSCSIYGEYGKISRIDKDIDSVSLKNNIKENMKKKMMVSNIDDVDSSIDENGICIKIEYGRKSSIWGIRRYLGLEDNRNEIRRYMSFENN